MKRYLNAFAALGMSLMSGALTPALKAGEVEKTIITISQPLAVEGTMLPPGRYVLRLQDSSSGTEVVYIFNGEGTRLIAAILGNRTYRTQPSSKTVLSFYDSQAGQPLALHTWFSPGESSGIEFTPSRHAAAGGSGAAAGN